MQRLYPDNLGRLLHEQLYQRLINFGTTYTPEFPIDQVVTYWLNDLFYKSNQDIHILVNYDSSAITAHSLIVVETAFNLRVVICYQAQDDKRSGTFINETIEYLDKLKDSSGAYIIKSEIPLKHIKTYKNKYGYTVSKATAIK